jgi:hypothetical protein
VAAAKTEHQNTINSNSKPPPIPEITPPKSIYIATSRRPFTNTIPRNTTFEVLPPFHWLVDVENKDPKDVDEDPDDEAE